MALHCTVVISNCTFTYSKACHYKPLPISTGSVPRQMGAPHRRRHGAWSSTSAGDIGGLSAWVSPCSTLCRCGREASENRSCTGVRGRETNPRSDLPDADRRLWQELWRPRRHKLGSKACDLVFDMWGCWRLFSYQASKLRLIYLQWDAGRKRRHGGWVHSNLRGSAHILVAQKHS